MCRFINADEYTGTGQGFLGYNTFAYCANNPVTRADGSGVFWDTVFDVISLAISVKGVIDDPQSGEAWASLAADVVCLVVPGLTGGGAIVKAVTKLDDVADAARTVENLTDAAKAADSLTDSSKVLQTADSLDFGACFIAGTLVLTSSGYVPIESINVGQYVWAADPEADAVTLKQVVQTFVNETTELIHVTVNGEEIVCTSEHPFYLSDNGWTPACELSVGDALIAFDNKSVVVEKIEFEQLDSPAFVYNFEVEDYHSYYVGQAPILVHNACAQGRGIGGKGWIGDKTWRENVDTVANGGTITSLNGGVPTQNEALLLIEQTNGTPLRIEDAHDFPNPHNFPHINYLTGDGKKGTIRIVR